VWKVVSFPTATTYGVVVDWNLVAFDACNEQKTKSNFQLSNSCVLVLSQYAAITS